MADPESTLEADIFHGDALDTMRRMDPETFEAIITDPPYCSGAAQDASIRTSTKGQGTRKSASPDGGWFINDAMGTAGLVWLLRSMACEAHRLLVRGGSLCLFCDWRMIPSLAPALESSGLRWFSLVVWDKGTAGMGHVFRCQHEMILHYTKGTPTNYDRSMSNVIRCSRVPAKRRFHPTQKPVDLIRGLIRATSPPEGRVLDPFAGSGSIGVACEMEGRSFTGIERDGRFVEVASERVGITQPNLFS